MLNLRPHGENIVMNKFKSAISISLSFFLGACIPAPDPTPKLGRIFIAPKLESFLLQGRNLKPVSVVIGGQVANIVEVGSDNTTIKVKPVSPLEVGEYAVEVTIEGDQKLSSANGVTVIDGQNEVAAGDLGKYETRDDSIIKGEAVIIFDPSNDQNQIKKAVEDAGFEIVRNIDPVVPEDEGIAGDQIWQVQDNDNRTTLEAIDMLEDELSDFPDVNLRIGIICGVPPSLKSRVLEPSTIARANTAQPLALPNDLSKARVAVLDTGINAHSAFDFGNSSNFIDSAATRNFTSEADNLDNAMERAPDGTPISSSNVGHGTAVAGLVYGTLSSALGADVVRANADKFIVPVKVCEGKIGRCRALDVALGIYYAINQPNVKVINLSLGNRIGSSLILEALEAAQKKGVTVIVSAGNQGQNPMKPSSFPAAYSVSNASGKVLPDLINVGSIRETATAGGLLREPSAFSSEGAWVDLVANGEELKSSSAAAVDAQGLYTGTSFSAPQVAALAALVQAKNIPAPLSPLEVKTFLLSKANAVANCAKTKCGAGVVDPRSFLK
jgi:subtilisin family serine protease